MLREYATRTRRAFLGAIAGATTALAGCEGDPDPSGTSPRSVSGSPTDRDTASATAGTAVHDHSGPAEGGASLRPADLRVGRNPTDRQLVTDGERRVSVPGDYDTVQAAVSDIPLFVRHGYSINVAPGRYDEDVVVPAFVKTHHGSIDSEGGFVNLAGDEENPGDVELGSLYVAGPTGRLPFAVLGLTLTRENPYDDEATALAFYGGGEHYVRNVHIGDGTADAIGNGVLAYAASVHVDWVDFGVGTVRGHAYSTKHGGQLMEQKVRETPSRGTVGGYAYDPEEGTIFFRGESSALSGDAGLVNGESYVNGIAIDTESRSLYNVGELVENR